LKKNSYLKQNIFKSFIFSQETERIVRIDKLNEGILDMFAKKLQNIKVTVNLDLELLPIMDHISWLEQEFTFHMEILNQYNLNKN
jgi:hypothetical protein